MDQTDEFFVKGLENYLDANSAVNLFEKEVQRRVRTAIDRSTYEPELTALFGKLSLTAYIWTDLPKRIHLGQQALIKDCGTLYFYLEFRRDEGNSSVLPALTLWQVPRDLMTPLRDSIRASAAQYPNVTLNIGRTSLVMTSSRPCADWDSCKRAFNELLASWTQLWKGFGGLRKMADDLKPEPQVEDEGQISGWSEDPESAEDGPQPDTKYQAAPETGELEWSPENYASKKEAEDSRHRWTDHEGWIIVEMPPEKEKQ